MENIKPASKPLEFLEFLNRFLPWIQLQIPTPINAGGCGIFARMLLQKLRQLGFKSKIYAIIDDKVTTKPKRLLTDTINGTKAVNKFPIGHVVLKPFRDIYLDSNGINSTLIEKSAGEDYIQEIDEDFLDKLIEEASWNNVFDRDQIPEIQELMNKINDMFQAYLNGEEIEFIKEEPEYTLNTKRALESQHMDMFSQIFKR